LRRSNSGIRLLLTAGLPASDAEMSSSEEHLQKIKRGTIYMKQAGGYM